MRDTHLPPRVVWDEEEGANSKAAEETNNVTDMYKQLHTGGRGDPVTVLRV